MLEGVSKAYGRRVVHDGLDLTIRRGERWCVMGKNGAGKTTLLKMVAGALDARRGRRAARRQPEAGLLRPAVAGRARSRPDGLGADAEGLPRRDVGALRSLLGAFQFSGDDVDKKIRALSGGEKSRLVMARMLLDPPNFLVLDEPTNHLDLATKEMLVEALPEFEGPCSSSPTTGRSCAGLSNRVLELGGESGTEPEPHLYPGSYVEYVERTGHEAPGVHA